MGMPLKLGMFIHFGIYSLLGYHEQVRWKKNISRDEYSKLADKFTLEAFEPDKWVTLARNAGMEYICVTAKHHDGFCMFDTKYTDFNIMNTPYGKDFLEELSEACRRGGIRLSLYYSNPDWNCSFAYNSKSTHQMREDGDEENTARLREFQKNQIRELLTNYGDIYTFFWDIPTGIEDKSMNEFIRSLQPDILINDRGWGDRGDFSTPEREVPAGGRFERYTEACQSVGKQSWGYCADEDYFTPGFLISSIDKIRVNDGSYLLNVGSMSNGRIPTRAAEIVSCVGDWYNRVKEAFEGEPFGLLENKSLMALKKDDILYVHIPNGLTSCGLTLKPIADDVEYAILLNDGRSLKHGVTVRPLDMNMGNGTPTLHIFDIPADEFPGETIVLKLKF